MLTISQIHEPEMLSIEEQPVAAPKIALFDRLMSGDDLQVYVLGRNKYAQRVSRSVPVRAFVDDFAKEKNYLDRPIIRMSDLPDKCFVVSCVLDTLPVTASDRLRSLGVRDSIDYFTLSRLAPDMFEPVDFCTDNRRDILNNTPQYKWVYERLADKISRLSFAKLVQFRLNLDVEQMRGFSLTIDRQYFEDFLPAVTDEVFVDGGGFDGQTTAQFTARNPCYRRVHYFEPTPSMMEISKSNLAGLRDVRFMQQGLYSRNDKLSFDADAGPASSLSATGKTEIEVARLDDAVTEPITFLKLDIEGAEYDALAGAERHIRTSTPKLAVCIYHRQEDFWRIPQRVLQYNNNYQIYLRHYSESIRETVMFFVPHK